MKLLFHPLAEKEFEISADWYKEKNIKLEKRFIKSVLNSIDLIIDNPYSFRKIKGEKRTAKVSGFPFSIIYIADINSIFVISVFHHSRNPKIWDNRY